MLLPKLLSGCAQRFPDKLAIVSCSDRISFADLELQSNRVAARLRRLGIGPGDRVAILHNNSVAAIVFFWGILKSGAQTVDMPTLAGGETLTKILRECRPKALVTSDSEWKMVISEIQDGLPSIVLSKNELTPSPELKDRSFHSLCEICATENADHSQLSARESEVAMIVYTSGTTGQPKGVMLSHNNLISNLEASNGLMGLTSEDSILVVVPLHFIHGRMQLLLHALIGGTIGLSAGFHFPHQVLNELVQYKVTGFSGVPYHFITLVEGTALGRTALPDLRYVVITGGALSPDALRKVIDALPGVAVHLAYGQTEASPRITYLSPAEVLLRPNSIGRALPGVHVEILGEGGHSMPPGTAGEIVVSGPNIMSGYVSGDQLSSGKIDQHGRLHTGDIGTIDSEGYIYISGRKSMMIKSAGERIFPLEIEAILDAHPGVRESGVLGVPDNLLGEKLVACVVPAGDGSVSGEELRTHCLKSLPFVRTPREIRFVDQLPKTASGKIDRVRLQSFWADAPSRSTVHQDKAAAC
jgi:acyl-CoA synthetase (AMP-forming)/AMP-acid ligase II